MKTIWKFGVELSGEFVVRMPRGAEFLDVQLQYEDPRMWFRVDSDAEKEDRVFAVHCTGHPAPGAYLGTFQMRGGTLAFHLFEVT